MWPGPVIKVMAAAFWVQLMDSNCFKQSSGLSTLTLSPTLHKPGVLPPCCRLRCTCVAQRYELYLFAHWELIRVLQASKVPGCVVQ